MSRWLYQLSYTPLQYDETYYNKRMRENVNEKKLKDEQSTFTKTGSHFVRRLDPERKHGHLGIRILIILHMKCWKRMGADVPT
jgi:hypothetical protein